MAECSKCKSTIRGESGIRCNGVCGRVYHFTKKCAGIDQYSAKIIDEDNFVRYICNDCMLYIQNVGIALREIQASVDKNKQTLLEYKHELEISLRQNECEIKALLEAIEGRYDDRFKKIDNIQKLCERNMQEVKSLYGNINEVENKNKDIYDKIEKNNVQMCKEVKKVIKDANEKTTKITYAQSLKPNMVMPDVSKNVPLIIKPKEKQSVEKTKAELNKKVDPINFKITNVENRKNGTLVIQSENVEEREKIKEVLQSEISENYEIKIPKDIKMQIIITGMNFKMSDNELIKKLKKQNEVMKDSIIEVVKLFETKQYNRTIFNAKLKIDNDSYPKIMTGQKLNVGWDRCKVFDGTDIIQCFKCQGYNHKSSECRNESICYKCHGNHRSKDCNKGAIMRCVNCVKENKRLNLGLDENHGTNNRECPVYQNKLNNKKRRIGLSAQQPKHIRAIYTNIQGLINNFNQLEILAETEKPEFIILSETHQTEEIDESEIEIDHYDHYSTLSNSSRTGGIIAYFKKHWKVNKIKDNIKDTKHWISAYKVLYETTSLIIIIVYRSPSSSKTEFCDAFQDFIEEMCETNCDILVAGDFNIDWKNDFYTSKLESILNDNGLKHIMNEYTRITANSKTLIDYIITNKEGITAKNNINNKIADHESIDILVECETKQQYDHAKEISIFKYDKNKFKNELSAILRCDEIDELNEYVQNFDDCVEKVIKKFTFKKKISEKGCNKWFNNELRTLKREKILKYQRAILENTNEAWNSYKIIRNKYKVKIEKEKSNYINNKINNANNQKEMWNKIKELVLRKPKTVIKTVKYNQIEYKDSFQIAKNFNTYFVNSVNEIRCSIENIQYENKIPLIDTKFKFRAINLQELKIIFKNIKKKPDYTKLSSNIILDSWDTTGNIILNIINKSLETGVFPNNWKESMVFPIQKVKNTLKCEEYRPINTLKICEKVIEKIVKNQLEEYMEQHRLLSRFQSGFRKKYSCETAINYVINRWKFKKIKNKILAIFLDFKRAFETIDRDILLQKLSRYGIWDTELKWFQSYLTNRKQFTNINNEISNAIENDFGVPQGSILGALLFVIYINDMEHVLKKCEIVLYADDTLIFAEAETEELCHENLKNDMDNISKWLKMNKLKLNENKTKLMEINMNTNRTFQINNVMIEKVNNIKYLGFLIDKGLNFKEHVEYICKKIGRKIGFFKRLRNKVTILTAINIYNTMIKPHFEYGSTVLYTCCSLQQQARLQKLQNKAMRSILKCNRFTSIRYMLDALKWLDIKQRLQLNTICFIQKIKMGNAPECLLEQIRYVGDIQPYNLRNALDFRPQRADTNSMQKSLFSKGLKLYNMMPNEVKNETNINIFRKGTVNFVKGVSF